MIEGEADNQRLRDAFSTVDQPADLTRDCPGDEEIWAASRGELVPERTRLILAHSLECGHCKRSWLVASSLAAESSTSSSQSRDAGGGRVIPFQIRHHRLLKVASAVAATLVLFLLLTTVLNREESSVTPVTLAGQIRTDLWRVGESQPLADGDRLHTGDRIYLTLQSDVPVHLYVINKDQIGDSAALFPVPDAQWNNPLPAGESLRLPGGRGWKYDSWEVSSSSGRESFTVVAALEPRIRLESTLALLDAASPREQVLRGRAAVEPGPKIDPDQAAAALAAVLDALRNESGGSVVVREIVLENPRSPAP
jgi:hypothetical protein